MNSPKNMMKKMSGTFLIILFFLSMGHAAAGQQDDSQRWAPRLKQLMAEVMTEYDVPGMAMAVRFVDGSTLSYAAGLADRDTGERLTIDHHFRIGSATKTITATATLLLCRQGAFGLDDRVAPLLPEIKEFAAGGPLRDSNITVRMLLQHTSGLKDYVDGEYNGEDIIDIMLQDPLHSLSFQDMVTASYNMGWFGKPGETFEYSNTNYILLGMLIEKFSGMSYVRFVRKNIFDPLGLTETSVPETCDMPTPYTHGYLELDADGRLHDYTRQDPKGVWAAGNVISTPKDLLQWLEALEQGRLLNLELKAQQFQMRDFPDAHLGYGLGVASFGGPIGHNGTVMGYQTWMAAYNGAYFVMYSNGHYPLKKVHIANILFDRIVKLMFPEGQARP